VSVCPSVTSRYCVKTKKGKWPHHTCYLLVKTYNLQCGPQNKHHLTKLHSLVTTSECKILWFLHVGRGLWMLLKQQN